MIHKMFPVLIEHKVFLKLNQQTKTCVYHLTLHVNNANLSVAITNPVTSYFCFEAGMKISMISLKLASGIGLSTEPTKL